MKRLIVNGDDYGYTLEKSEGILKAHREGILTSTTVMVNLVSKPEINKLLKYKKNLGIGLHLNITKGKPVSLFKEVPSLVNEKKEMFKPRSWARKDWNDFGNLKNMAEVELEFNNQIKMFKETLKIMPSHLDSHQCITSHKKVFPILVKLAKENDLPVRLPGQMIEDKNVWEHRIELDMPLARETKKQCKTTDFGVFDFFFTKRKPLEELKKTLKALKAGTTELMFHPSLLKTEDKNSVFGKIDLDLLTNQRIKKIIKEENIQLMSYKEL